MLNCVLSRYQTPMDPQAFDEPQKDKFICDEEVESCGIIQEQMEIVEGEEIIIDETHPTVDFETEVLETPPYLCEIISSLDYDFFMVDNEAEGTDNDVYIITKDDTEKPAVAVDQEAVEMEVVDGIDIIIEETAMTPVTIYQEDTETNWPMEQKFQEEDATTATEEVEDASIPLSVYLEQLEMNRLMRKKAAEDETLQKEQKLIKLLDDLRCLYPSSCKILAASLYDFDDIMEPHRATCKLF